MSHQDDVLFLEREFADAMQRMYTVGNGLARLRADLSRPATDPAAGLLPVLPTSGGPASPQGAHAGPSAPSSVPAGPATDPAVPAAGPLGPPPGARAARSGDGDVPPPVTRESWYRREGMVTRVLGVAGAVVTLSGVAMLLVLAVRHGWFGPGARVTAGGLLAVVLGLLGARGGARDRARDGTVGNAPVALVATGAAAGYLDVVAVTTVYGWVPAALGLLLCTGVAAAGLWLARTWRSDLLAGLAVGGAAAFSPVVAGEPGWVLTGVLGVLAAAGWWAADGRPAPRLTVVRTVPVALSTLAAAGSVTGPARLLALLVVTVLVLAGVLAASAATLRRHPADVVSTVAVAAVAVGALAVAAAQPEPLRTLALGGLAAALLLCATAFGRPPVGPLPAHLVATTAVSGALAAVLAVLAGAPDRFVGTGLLVLALAHVAVAGATRSRLTLAVGAGVAAVAVTVWLQHPVAMVSVGAATAHDLAVAAVDSLLVVGLAALAAGVADGVRRIPAAVRRAVSVLTVALALAALATALVGLGTLAGAIAGAALLGFTVGHALATVVWMVAAAALLLRSRERGSDLALRCGLALVAVAVAKLFLFDLASLDGVVRSVAFIATGLLLLATGSRYARSWERPRAGA
ncbi:DUF2339 domain-containing protein [Phycicoccus flavus]|uniref:DUF2339 domain-containing protein n=1 Tax=Phycicoccus flavus TaxID=2502783 RepID=UPI000FEB9D98|nr:DUF2339 domain-containing protein [Phycicoccus flavus]NHA67937.1 DUF2339 domain-containing protein [Phycicoccus flavus]